MKTAALNDDQQREVRQIEQRLRQACLAMQRLRTQEHFVGREQQVRAQYQAWGACIDALIPLVGEQQAIDRACQIYNTMVRG